MENEISRLVDAVAEGSLVDDLKGRMRQAEARRERLRQDLAVAENEAASWLQVIPGAVKAIVDDLGRMLRQGQVERVKAALSRLVEKIEVHEEPRPERKRPAAKLIFRGNLLGAVGLALEKVKTCGSPGGIRTRDLMAENHVS